MYFGTELPRSKIIVDSYSSLKDSTKTADLLNLRAKLNKNSFV